MDRWSLAWFIDEAERPMDVIRDPFVEPIIRWSYTVPPRGRSTGGYVLYPSLPSLVRWIWGLAL